MLPENINTSFSTLEKHGVDIGNYDQLWCVDETVFTQMLWQVQKMDLLGHVQGQPESNYDINAKEFATVGGGSIAIIDIEGTMTKKGSSLAAGGSTIRVRRAIRQAVADDTISAIILRVDSPGGTVSGTADLAKDVKQAASRKKVVGFVEDLAASAACWVISQCSEVYANTSTAQVGSIGTYMALYDMSAAAEKEGIKPVVIKSGEFKAGGFPGTAISDELKEQWQSRIDAIQKEFTAAVAAGRKLPVSKVEELANGLTYMASDAVSLGLIDGVRSFDQVVSDLRTSKKGVAMSETTFSSIAKACNGLDAKSTEGKAFIADCLAEEMSEEEAAVLWSETILDRVSKAESKVDDLTSENADLKAQVEKLESDLEAAQKPNGKGVPAVGTTIGKKSSEDARTEWRMAISEKVKSGMTRSQAVKAVNREQPELREALVADANS